METISSSIVKKAKRVTFVFIFAITAPIAAGFGASAAIGLFNQGQSFFKKLTGSENNPTLINDTALETAAKCIAKNECGETKPPHFEELRRLLESAGK